MNNNNIKQDESGNTTKKLNDQDTMYKQGRIDAEVVPLTDILKYLQDKYIFEVHFNKDKMNICIKTKTGIIIIPYYDLLYFITDNINQYESISFDSFELIDIYLVLMLTNALDNLIYNTRQDITINDTVH